MYFEFLEKKLERKGLKVDQVNKLGFDTMGNLMYIFIQDLQIREIERLSDRNRKLKQGIPVGVILENQPAKKSYDSSDEDEPKNPTLPIGYQYENNFPSFSDPDGKGKMVQ